MKSSGKYERSKCGQVRPNWEGPYRVTATAKTGAYYLEDMEERPLP